MVQPQVPVAWISELIRGFRATKPRHSRTLSSEECWNLFDYRYDKWSSSNNLCHSRLRGNDSQIKFNVLITLNKLNK